MKSSGDNQTLSIYSYTSYRQFIVDWLQVNQFTYRSFVARHPGLVSLIALAKLLSRGRSGKRDTSSYRMAPETLARLGKALRLSDAELRHLLLLRLENDADEASGAQGATYKKILRGLLEDNRRAAAGGASGQKPAKSQNQFSPTAKQIARIIDLLPNRFRERLLDEALQQGRIFAARQSGRPGINTLHNLLQELKGLKDLGAP